jgi:murein DD-endopeptidase MepM/ murein hydrolase activator NlpD
MNLATLIENNRHQFVSMFRPELNKLNTIHIDLSAGNHEFDGLSEAQLDFAIVDKIEQAAAIAAVGGYLENRSVYRDTELFQGQADRSIHLGVDVFMPAGTAVYAPLEAEVCCFANRPMFGDYGPVIILRHQLDGIEFHSLYGHLAQTSLDGLSDGKLFAAGEKIGEMGLRPANGNWPPHLHFQLIGDLQGLGHDYPGVARAPDLGFYQLNCPDPNSIILA